MNIFTSKGRESRQENVGQHSQGPDIGSKTDRLVRKNFRCCNGKNESSIHCFYCVKLISIDEAQNFR